MRLISLDFETYSETDISLGGSRYMEDAIPLCMASAVSEGESLADILSAIGGGAGGGKNIDLPVELWLPGQEVPHIIQEPQANDYYLAWNVAFERDAIRKFFGIEPAPISQWIDTMALARSFGLPGSLAECGEIIGLNRDLQKDKEGKKLINLLCKPVKKKGKLVRNTDSALLAKLYEYCKQDVIAERGIYAWLATNIAIAV